MKRSARKLRDGGTTRNVDSSVERVQVKVSGWTDPRYVVTCNGRRLPLYPTESNGEFIAGVRYRAPGSRLSCSTGLFRCTRRWSSTS